MGKNAGKRERLTLRHWANQNVDGKSAEAEYTAIRKLYPGYVEVPSSKNFRQHMPSHSCDKLTVYAWYWRGEWADPTLEVYKRLYLPKSA